MSRLSKNLFLLGDILLLNGVTLLVFALSSKELFGDNHFSLIYLLVYSNLGWIFLVIISTPYHTNKRWSLSKVFKHQLALLSLHFCIMIFLVFFFDKKYSIIQIIYIYIVFSFFFFVWKFSFFSLRRIFAKTIHEKRYILVGQNELAYQLRKYYLVNSGEGRKFYGYFTHKGEQFIDKVRVFCEEHNIHEIYCCVPEADDDDLIQLIELGLNSLIKVRVITSLSMHGIHTTVRLSSYDVQPGVGKDVIPLDRLFSRLLKRMFDVIFAFLVLIFVMPWMLLIVGILIKLDSSGPIIFSQARGGKKDKPFACFKFRTMYVNDESDVQLPKQGDKRVTKIGYFLRKTSIDEFPQFINVLMGSMSVVGPRPHMISENESYVPLIKNFKGRLYVKPGVTGLAQCLGYRGHKTGNLLGDLSDMEGRVRMDFYYIQHWSPLLDIKIILLTIVGLLRNRSTS